MDWSAMQAAVKTAIVSALGVSATQVHWENASSASTWIAFPSIKLSIKAPRAIGVDQVVYAHDALSDQLQPTHEGPREITIVVKIESDSQSPGADAVGYLSSRLRTRIRWQSIRDALNAAGLSLSTIAPTVQADFRSDGRMLSAGVTELVLLAAESDRDSLWDGSYFDTVTAISESLRGPDGVALSEQESFTVPEA